MRIFHWGLLGCLTLMLASCSSGKDRGPSGEPPNKPKPPEDNLKRPVDDPKPPVDDPEPPPTVAKRTPISNNPALTLRERKTLPIQAKVVSLLAFGPENNTLIAAGNDGRIVLWDLATGKELASYMAANKDHVYIAAHPDGKTVVFAQGPGDAIILDLISGKELSRIPGLDCDKFAFSPDGKLLALWDGKQMILWDMLAKKQIFAGWSGKEGEGGVLGLQFSPDSKTLALAVSRVGVILWDMPSAREKKRIPLNSIFTYLAFSPDGKLLAGGSYRDKELKLWELDTGKEHAGAKWDQEGATGRIAFSPDGKLLATGRGEGLTPTVTFFDGQTLKEVVTVKLPGVGTVDILALSRDGKSLATCIDEKITVWDVVRENKRP